MQEEQSYFDGEPEAQGDLLKDHPEAHRRRRGIAGTDDEIKEKLQIEEEQYLPPAPPGSSADNLGIGDFADKGHHAGNTPKRE